MRLYIEAILIYLLGSVALYFGLAGFGAFIYADWSVLDFTTWGLHSRFFFVIVYFAWCALCYAACKHKGVFNQ